MKTAAPLVRFKAVDVDLGERRILRNVSWQLKPGQNWVVLGRNGSGKSTFLRLIRGELWPLASQAGRRIYQLNGQPQTTAVGVKEQMAIVSPEQQSRYLYHEWNLTAAQVIESGVGGGDYVYQRLTPDQRRHVEETMRRLNVDQFRTRLIHELSTGELRRVLIARALCGRPRVLICDEIGDGLDAASRALLLETLDGAAEAGTQLLLATHRVDEIPRAMTHRMWLENGQVMEQGKLGNAGGRREFKRRFGGPTRVPSKPSQSRERKREGELLIKITGADVYLGLKPTLQNIHLEIRSGQHWAILGPNGSGKSTLLRLVSGDVHAAFGGRVRRFNFTGRNTLWELRKRLGYISPDLQANYREPIPGEDVVATGFSSSVGVVRRPITAERRRIREVMRLLQLTPLARKNFLEMSYGEARRILLARALVKNPALILFDEPFDGLDVTSRRTMTRAIGRAAEQGATLLIVTHHADDLPDCITHVARMENGRLNVGV